MPGYWSLSTDQLTLVGQYQPESFTDSFEAKFDEQPNIGTDYGWQFVGYAPRAATISFVVDNLNVDPVDKEGDRTSGMRWDPEAIYEYLIRVARPTDAASGLATRQQPIKVNVPGWSSSLQLAFIKGLSIERTHIGPDGRALRAKITVNLIQTFTNRNGLNVASEGGNASQELLNRQKEVEEQYKKEREAQSGWFMTGWKKFGSGAADMWNEMTRASTGGSSGWGNWGIDPKTGKK